MVVSSHDCSRGLPATISVMRGGRLPDGCLMAVDFAAPIFMKKMVFVLFLMGTCCLGAAIQLSKQPDQSLKQERYVEPERLSQININDYVSLPVIEGLKVHEAEEEDVEADTKAAFEKILETAEKLDIVYEHCTVIADITISDGDDFIERFTNEPIGVGGLGTDLDKALVGADTSDSVKVSNVPYFLGYSNVDVRIKIKEIYNMEYPVTEEYMKTHTEYTSLDDMARSIRKMKVSEKRTAMRENTMDALIPETMKATTFVIIPDSLCEKELEVLNEDGESHDYDEAEENVKKLLFLKAVLMQYDLAPESELNGGEDYKQEREQILSYEEDVKTFLYKKISVIKE